MNAESMSSCHDRNDRVRAKNFTNSELDLLINLVNEKQNIIESKETGVVSNKQKGAAWDSLTQKFNASSGTTPRTPKTLKEKWANIKKNAVKNYAADKRFRKGTGGGPSRPSHETSQQKMINAILGARMTGMAAVCDSDVTVELVEDEPAEAVPGGVSPGAPTIISKAVSFCKNVTEAEGMSSFIGQEADYPIGEDNNMDISLKQVESTQITSSMVQSVAEKTQEVQDWSDYTPSKLKTPVTKLLQVSTKGKKKATGLQTNEKWCQLADEKKKALASKLKILEDENTRKKELHELIMTQLKEEHAQKLRHKDAKHLLKLKLMQEEHDQKMKLMQQQNLSVNNKS